MKNIIRKILLQETFKRDWIDSEYADEYPKYKGMIINAIKMDLIASGQSENKIMLFDSDKKVVIDYYKKSKTLYFDYGWAEDIEKLISWQIYVRHFKYALADFFNDIFPDVLIKDVRGAHIYNN
jgi:hypothetical protein